MAHRLNCIRRAHFGKDFLRKGEMMRHSVMKRGKLEFVVQRRASETQ
jgi:hypothetical protein